MTSQAILFVHIAAGALSVLAGAAALVFRKGGPAHRAAGTVFVAAMTIMALSAAVVGMENPGNVVAGALVIYLVVTSLATVRRRAKGAGLFEGAAFVAALAFAVLFAWSTYRLAIGQEQAENPVIFGVTVFMSAVLVIAALGDLNVVLRRGVAGAQRVARHLWRMCFGLFIAVGSFMAQGIDALPPALRRVELLLASMLLVLLVMAYWLVRVRFTRWRPRIEGRGADQIAEARA